jgi:hypothetical protein
VIVTAVPTPGERTRRRKAPAPDPEAMEGLRWSLPAPQPIAAGDPSGLDPGRSRTRALGIPGPA